MHPYLHYQLIQIHAGELHSRAERHRIVQDARRADRQPATHRLPGPGSALRRLLSARPASPTVAVAYPRPGRPPRNARVRGCGSSG
jgi:hypothetical protein